MSKIKEQIIEIIQDIPDDKLIHIIDFKRECRAMKITRTFYKPITL